MSKVSIITRCYNKLEYTIRCIESIRRYTRYDNYEHIIINNNSTDGTDGWLNWIYDNKLNYFKRVIPFNMNKNYGDWGGMLKGLDLVSEDSEYIVQMDNDIEIKDPYWIQKMILVLEQDDVNIIQLKRNGMYNNIIPKDIKEIKFQEQILEYGKSPANRPVAFFMIKTNDFKRIKDELPLDLHEGKSVLSNLLGGTYKFSNVYCYLIDGHSKDLGFQVHEMKYPREITYQNKQTL